MKAQGKNNVMSKSVAMQNLVISKHKIRKSTAAIQSTLRHQAVSIVNQLLGAAGLKLAREHDWSDPRTYIPFKTTQRAALRAGLSIGEYVDDTYNVAGATQETVDEMAKLGIFDGKIEYISEIGPGSGRYLEKVAQMKPQAFYEIYETATAWGNWLADHYRVTFQPTDGKWLSATPTAAVDLLHAHKAFGVMPFLSTCRYFYEIARVVKPGGKVVFDIVTEECMDDETLDRWIESGIQSGPYPSFIAKDFTLSFFQKRGFKLIGNFFIPMKPGKTEYLAFIKTK